MQKVAVLDYFLEEYKVTVHLTPFAHRRGFIVSARPPFHLFISTVLNKNHHQRNYTIAHEIAEIECVLQRRKFLTGFAKEVHCHNRARDILVPEIILDVAMNELKIDSPLQIQRQIFPHASLEVVGRQMARLSRRRIFFNYRPAKSYTLYDPVGDKIINLAGPPFSKDTKWKMFEASKNYRIGFEETNKDRGK